jgi:hypothetical protein
MSGDVHAFRNELRRGLRRYRPSCTCGWRGRPRFLSESSRHEWLEHLPFEKVCRGE